MLDTQSGYSLSRIFLKIFAIISLVVLSVPSAQAVPSYSRQTGLPCASCHYAPRADTVRKNLQAGGLYIHHESPSE
jgi:hypothetical protein